MAGDFSLYEEKYLVYFILRGRYKASSVPHHVLYVSARGAFSYETAFVQFPLLSLSDRRALQTIEFVHVFRIAFISVSRESGHPGLEASAVSFENGSQKYFATVSSGHRVVLVINAPLTRVNRYCRVVSLLIVQTQRNVLFG